MRWFTCTPVAFGGGPDFFARDSGLLCRGFQALGCESRAVMPGERKPEDDADLIRTDFANLESAAWWRGHQLDGVVLYAWGSPKFRKVARAIRQAGIFLVLNQDNGGLISPLAGFRGWIEEQWIMTGRGDQIAFLKTVARGIAGLIATDPMRAAHLKEGNVIACVSPVAASHYRKLCRIYGGTALTGRVKLLPHPVETRFHFEGAKTRQVACVGRWQDHLQKRPLLMQAVIRRLVESDTEVRVEIVGNLTDPLQDWHHLLGPDLRERVSMRGMVNREQLAEILRRSQVFYSPSAFESFGIAAGEALCSGCSVAAGRSVSMASFEWFVSENSGTLAAADNAEGHLGALLRELESWRLGLRDPVLIAARWRDRLHEDRVAAKALEFASDPKFI